MSSSVVLTPEHPLRTVSQTLLLIQSFFPSLQNNLFAGYIYWFVALMNNWTISPSGEMIAH